METFIQILVMLCFFLGGMVLLYWVGSWLLTGLKDIFSPSRKVEIRTYEPPRSFMSYSAEELANKKLQVNFIYNVKILAFVFVFSLIINFIAWL